MSTYLHPPPYRSTGDWLDDSETDDATVDATRSTDHLLARGKARQEHDADDDEKEDAEYLTFLPVSDPLSETERRAIIATNTPSRARRWASRFPRVVFTLILLVIFTVGYLIRLVSLPDPPSFASSLARSDSMRPSSALSFLPIPFNTLGREDAMDYIKHNWGYRSGASSSVDFVRNPFTTGWIGWWFGRTVMRVDFPQGSYSGTSGGVSGLHLEVMKNGRDKVQRAIVSYEVAFSEGFDFVKGGKLPGAFGGERKDGCSGGQHSERCLSLRLMWRQKGDGEVYAYTPTYPEQCASDPLVACDGVYGSSLGRSTFNFIPPKPSNSTPNPSPWTQVTQQIHLNSEPNVANGLVALYKNGVEAFREDKMVLRTNMSVELNDLFFSTFFGGGDASWASKGGLAYFRNFEFFVGDAPSSGSGPTVKVNDIA